MRNDTNENVSNQPQFKKRRRDDNDRRGNRNYRRNEDNNRSKYILNRQSLLENGAHFGHNWKMRNPKMEQYIFSKRPDGTSIIDLNKTIKMFEEASKFVSNIVEKGQSILFVGTKGQVRKIVTEEAARAGMFYVVNRWLGGMLTNWNTVSQSIKKLKGIEALSDKDYLGRPKREGVKLEKLKAKLTNVLGGLADMKDLPAAIFIVDPTHDHIAVSEARKLNIPIIALVDTNADPDLIDVIIPANDDAIKAVRLFTSKIADACIQGAEKRQLKLVDNAIVESAGGIIVEGNFMPESKEPTAEVVNIKGKKDILTALADTVPTKDKTQ